MSSIFEDDKLLSELIKSVVDHEVKFNKHGQLAFDPNINVEYRNYLNLAKRLAEQLEERYVPTATSGPVVSAPQEANMGITDLASLGNFLDFIVQNQISVDGKRVVYGANEQVPDPRQWLPVSAEQVRFMQETVTPTGERAQFKGDYFVNRDLLSKYVNSILKDVSSQDEASQRFVKTMLSGLIQQINQIFKTKLTTEYKEPEKAKTTTTTTPTTQQQEGGAAAGGLSPQIFKQLASLKPFNSQYISFPEITRFLNLYAQLANDPNINTTIQGVQRDIDNFKNRLALPSDTIQMYNLTSTQFKSWLKNPAEAQLAVGDLYDIIHYAGQIYQRLVNDLQSVGRDPRYDPSIYRGMLQQIIPGGPQLTNIATLNSLRSNLQQEWNKPR